MSNLPVVVIGAGPVGLAAAAHLLERGENPLVLEAGLSAGANVLQWGHVRIFSPWRYNMDAASKRILGETAWQEPDAGYLPTGSELVRDYLEPLATQTRLRDHIQYGARVTAISRKGIDKVRTKGRDESPFLVRVFSRSGGVREIEAKAVIDASGTWNQPNPMGGHGLPVIGEELVPHRIDYGIPDVKGAVRKQFAGRTVTVVGSGHSSFNIVLDLLSLREEAPETRIIWLMRKESLGNVFGGGDADALSARGELGTRAKKAVTSGDVTLLTPMVIQELVPTDGDQVEIKGELASEPKSFLTDRIIVTTGFRPDLEMLRELRVEIDPWLESAREIGPLIDPNLHSCGTVRPHGARELAHPEKGFYIVGMKSYGRAPTFLMATGYEQVRSVVAEITGDHEAAARVELDLPETGVCSLDNAEDEESGCCGGPVESDAEACCRADEDAKAAGESGCGCGSNQPVEVPPEKASSCCG
jgi:thioredoxin reductase